MEANLARAVRELTRPEHTYERSQIIADRKLIPEVHGAYCAFFKTAPKGVPTRDCIGHQDQVLLYVGVAPGRRSSKRNLRDRVPEHFKNRTASSTLRRTLGCLLQDELSISFRYIKGKRDKYTLSGDADEVALSDWMETNVHVTWTQLQNPWSVEHLLIEQLRPPLNIDKNSAHPFHSTLHALRKETWAMAQEFSE